MNNSVINLVLYHDFLYNIKKHKADDAVGIIREYVAGDQIMRAKDTGSLHTKVLDLKEDMAIMGVEEYVIEEYYGEQGNICFFTKHEVAGAEVIGIPVRFGEGVRAMLLPDSLDPDYNVVLVNESDVATHFKKLSEHEDAEFVLYKWDDEQGKHAFWHTSAHLLAEALQELYPGIQFGIGPAIENGFYYDVDPGEAVIKEGDLPAIEKKMAELASKKEELVRRAYLRKMP
jgi:hypothetical protein